MKAEPAEVEKKPEVEPESVEPTGRGSSEYSYRIIRSGSGSVADPYQVDPDLNNWPPGSGSLLWTY